MDPATRPEAPMPTWWTLLPVRFPILIGWLGGPDADKLAGCDKNVLLDQAINSLGPILGVLPEYAQQQLTASYLDDWH